MPAIGAVAIAAAPSLARRFESTVRITAWTLAIFGAIVAALAIPAMTFVKVPMVRDALSGGEPWMFAGAIVFVAAAIIANLLRKRRHALRALAVLAIASMIGCQLATVLASRADDYFSAQNLIGEVVTLERRPPSKPDVPFYSVDMFDQTVPFYLGRTVTLVHDQNELTWGIEKEPAKYIATVEEFAQRWRDDTAAYAIMQRATYDKLATDGLPMRLVATDGRRAVVSRR